MNIVELLMAEHASLRLHFRYVREKNSDSIYEIEEFVRNCHATIEDELVFPKLREMIAPRIATDLVNVLARLESDHKLIDKIGEQIKGRTAEGDLETLRKRIMLYASTVETHNSSEETIVFPYWRMDRTEESAELVLRAKAIIEKFGLERYFRITGISEKLLESIH